MQLRHERFGCAERFEAEWVLRAKEVVAKLKRRQVGEMLERNDEAFLQLKTW